MNENNVFVWYSKKYNCSLIEAFNDRDEPMNAERIAKEWKDATGKEITEEELKACRPDSRKTISNQKQYYGE